MNSGHPSPFATSSMSWSVCLLSLTTYNIWGLVMGSCDRKDITILMFGACDIQEHNVHQNQLHPDESNRTPFPNKLFRNHLQIESNLICKNMRLITDSIDFWIMLCATLDILQARLSSHNCTPGKGFLLSSNNINQPKKTRPDLLRFPNCKLCVRTQILTRKYETPMTEQLRLVARSSRRPSCKTCNWPSSSWQTFSARSSLQKSGLSPGAPTYVIPWQFISKTHTSQQKIIHFWCLDYCDVPIRYLIKQQV